VTSASQPVVVVATGLALEARIAAGRGVRTITVGVDPARLADVLERELEHDAFAVMSFGIAGGLAPGLAPGTCVIARGVVGDDGYRRCDERWTHAMAARFPRAAVGDVAGSDAVIVDSARKRALHRATRAIAVDTESHVASRIALAYGLPFAAFRVVADPVERSLPPAVGGALGAGRARAGEGDRSGAEGAGGEDGTTRDVLVHAGPTSHRPRRDADVGEITRCSPGGHHG
jgi:nucleoside phosphorylase